MSKTALVTGATSGIGLAAAAALACNGYDVVGVSRRAKAGDNIGPVQLLPMDITNDASVQKGMADALDLLGGHIDLLVHCAGSGIAGSVADMQGRELLFQLDVNAVGAQRVCRALLPHMRGRGGRLILIGSVAGFVPIPYQSAYAASKHALRALCEALYLEEKPFGIHACLIEPGDTRTGFTEARLLCRDALSAVHGAPLKKALSAMEKSERKGPGPEACVKAILKAAAKRKPPVRIVVGPFYKLVDLARRLSPERLFLNLVGGNYMGGKQSGQETLAARSGEMPKE